MFFITPSYINDLARFLQLRESIRRFCKSEAKHLVVVPRSDYSSFVTATKLDDYVNVLIQEDFVISKFYPRTWYPVVQKLLKERSWRFNHYGGRSGWIIQQIVKLNYPEFCNAEYAILIDSDCIFFRDFSEIDFMGDYNEPSKILLKQYPSTESGMHRLYIDGARNILKLPKGSSDFHYMAYPAIFYQEFVLKLQKYIENVYSTHWQNVLFDVGTISEYSIYGIFIEEVLKPNDVKIRKTPFNLGLWNDNCVKNFDSIFAKMEQIRKNADDTDRPFCLTIQSNIASSTDELREKIIKRFINS